MTAHVHDSFTAGHRTATLIWAAIAVLALAVLAAVLVLVSTRDDTAPAAPVNGGANPTSHRQVTSNDCGPTRIVHPC
jgi:hypothetical protein